MGTGRVVWACLAPSPVSRRVGLGTDAIGETRRGAAAGRLSASEDKKLLAVSVIQCGRFYPVYRTVSRDTRVTTHRSSDLGRAAPREDGNPTMEFQTAPAERSAPALTSTAGGARELP